MVGDENIFIFGLTAEEVAAAPRRRATIRARSIEASPELAQALSAIALGRVLARRSAPLPRSDRRALRPRLVHGRRRLRRLCRRAARGRRAVVDQPQEWNARRSATSPHVGWFSSDRTIRQYAQEIWNVPTSLNRAGRVLIAARLMKTGKQARRNGRQTAALAQADVDAIVAGSHADPFAVLGVHGEAGSGFIARCFVPGAHGTSRPSRWTASGCGALTAPARCRLLRGRAERHASASRCATAPRNAGGEWWLTDPYSASVRCSGRWTTTIIARRLASAAVRQAGRASDRAMRAPTACISRSGRPMPGASRSSAISTPGTAGAMSMRLRGRHRHLGNLHPGHRRRAQPTSTRSSAPTARCCR